MHGFILKLVVDLLYSLLSTTSTIDRSNEVWALAIKVKRTMLKTCGRQVSHVQYTCLTHVSAGPALRANLVSRRKPALNVQ